MNRDDMLKYLRTVRHLRWSQIVWRQWYMVSHKFRPASLPSPPDGLGTKQCPVADPADFPCPPVFHSSENNGAELVLQLERGEFRHLNQCEKIGGEEPDWRLGSLTRDRLWVVNLHYHAWAFELAQIAAGSGAESERAASLFRHYVSDWIERCDLKAAGAGELAWNSFAVATRLSWWIRSLLAARDRLIGPDRGFESRMLSSMWRQAEYLYKHPEWDLRANHILRDAVGLAWAGRFFKDARAESWLAMAAKIAISQAREQVCPDGGHFERSIMYHVHIMEDILSLALLLDDEEASSLMAQTWSKMAEFLAWVRHPDGEIALFNDGALHAVAEPAHMLRLGDGIGVEADPAMRKGGRYFADTGLVAWHGNPWTVFFDVGLIGPDYQPGHGHADTLSIVASVGGDRIFVDPGTHSYDNDPRRAYDRSTRAHNTVCVDGVDSSEVWHIFRVGRRSRPLGVEVEIGGAGFQALASHDGYDHLPGRPRHVRALSVGDDKVLSIVDTVEGSGVHELEGGLLLAPGWKAVESPGGWNLEKDSGRVHVKIHGPVRLELKLENRAYHPEYGMEIETSRLTWKIKDTLPAKIQTIVEKT